MTSAITLSGLLSPWIRLDDPHLAAMPVAHLELDSRKVATGDVFVAVIGHSVDGRRFIPAAIEQGAAAVIAQACERYPHGYIDSQHRAPVIYLADLNQHLSHLAGRLYTSQGNALIGVTGTNGKTTITQLIAQWLTLLGKRGAVMGTTGNGFLDALKPAANTTGSAIDIQRSLSELTRQGAEYTALEVSSHGLVQQRVKALNFAVGVFSNLSRDHLDYHGSMEEYARAKFSLFTEHSCQHAVINVDDPVGADWADALPNAVRVSLKAQTSGDHTVYAEQIGYAESGIKIQFNGCFGAGTLQAPLIGEFNASNLMLAFVSLMCLGFDIQQLILTAPQLKPVLGRMELFQTTDKAKVVVDYAHTPDALEKALNALRVHCQGKLWGIFGCGGDRDRGKRPMMAEIAERLADHVILTDDNPRSEDPAAIMTDMLAGMQRPQSAIVQHSRFKALQHALTHAAANDIILLAGKGHEDYQIIANDTIHYSDRESAQTLLGLKE